MKTVLIVAGAVALRLLFYGFQLRGHAPRKVLDWLRGERRDRHGH